MSRLVELVGVNRLMVSKTGKIYTKDDSPYELEEEEAKSLLKMRNDKGRAMFLEVFEDDPETASEAAGDVPPPQTTERTSRPGKPVQGRKKGGVTISKRGDDAPAKEETVEV